MDKRKKESGSQRRKRLANEAAAIAKNRKIGEFFPLQAAPPREDNGDSDVTPDNSDDDDDAVHMAEISQESAAEPDDIESATDDDEQESADEVVEHREEENGENGMQQHRVIVTSDVGYFAFNIERKAIVSSDLRTELVRRGSNPFQHKEGPFQPDRKGRAMTSSWFFRKLLNGQTIPRTWLLYSPLRNAAYCFCCLLFSTASANNKSALETEFGFKHWRKPEKVTGHENNKDHRDAFRTWKATERRINDGRTLDADIVAMLDAEKERWRNILKRILDCIKFLACQNSALRGHVESISDESDNNPGNFLALMNLLSGYDQITQQHLEFARNNPNKTSYLSPLIQNEFIAVLADAVKRNLVEDIKEAKYYGMLFDSTPDLAHREQMSQVMRYVKIDYNTKTVTTKESFIGFIQIHDKTAADIEIAIVDALECDGIDLQDCRSQCYDNAAVMAGHLSGVQQRILQRNLNALFLNCDNHSLNLCGVHAASTAPVLVTFFGTVDSIYAFFSRSTQRWDRLKAALPISVKRECATRWSSRADAVNAINTGIEQLVDLLEEMTDDKKLTPDTRADAGQLQKAVVTFNFLALLPFWDKILAKIDRVQQRLQDPTMNFHDAYLDIKGLQKSVVETREDVVNDSITEGEGRCVEWDVDFEPRRRRKKCMPGELAMDAGLSAKEELDRVMKGVVDRVDTEMKNRFQRLETLDKRFGFLLDINGVFQLSEEELSAKCSEIADAYPTELSGVELKNEIDDCNMLLSQRENVEVETPKALLEFIISYGEDVFPNLRIALQILLTIAVSIASCERSFSKLKLILSYLRASMGQGRLNNLAQLSIERQTLRAIDFDDIIDEFAKKKARRVDLIR